MEAISSDFAETSDLPSVSELASMGHDKDENPFSDLGSRNAGGRRGEG